VMCHVSAEHWGVGGVSVQVSELLILGEASGRVLVILIRNL
jgi:hypothetical protein